MIWKRKEMRLGVSGLTLVELMVTLAIISILGAVAFSIAASTVPRYNLRAEARELVINFKFAKFEAMKRNREVFLTFTPGVGAAGSYRIFADADNDRALNVNVDTLLRTQVMRDNIQLTSVNFAGNPTTTTYDRRGMTTATGSCQLRMSDNSNWYRLTLSSTGTVRLSASRDQGVTWTVK